LSRVNDKDYETIETLIEVAESYGVQPNQVALAWLRSREVVSAPIVGASTIDQLKPLVESDLVLEDDHLKQLDQASDWVRSRTDLEE